MSIVRLAYGGPPEALAKGLCSPENQPALLVSYVYLKQFEKERPRYHFRDWAMDSGAFSAHNSGRTIDLQAYIDTCKRLLTGDSKLTEVFALDVIDDWKGSLKNTEAMWAAGVPAIPTYHQGEPWDALRAMARDYPKIGIGGMVGLHAKAKKDWIGQCFARVWPKKIHGLGVAGEEIIMSFPFHSVDATNWEMGPCAFGRWASYGGANLSIRGGQHNLRVEVEHYLKLERKARARWRKEMAMLDPAGAAPSVRLVAAAHASSRRIKAFGGG